MRGAGAWVVLPPYLSIPLPISLHPSVLCTTFIGVPQHTGLNVAQSRCLINEAGLSLASFTLASVLSISASVSGLGTRSPAPLLSQHYLTWGSYSLLIFIWLFMSFPHLIGANKEDR